MLFNYSNVLLFAVVGVLFIAATLFIGSLIRPHNPSAEKLMPYECGEVPVGSAWLNFNIRFYVTALVFVVFDVEIAFMFPVVRVFKDWVARGQGGAALIEIFIFVAILLVGLVYVWATGGLEWFKAVTSARAHERTSVRNPEVKAS